MICRVCHSDSLRCIIDRPPPALTSLAVIAHLPCRVFWCQGCGHLSTELPPEVDLAAYYDQEYDTVCGDADDLICFDATGDAIYRVQQQCDCLFELIDVPPTGRLLDFGCGHGGFMDRFVERRPRWSLKGFELSERYARPGVFINTMPNETFDLITAFYVLEHVEDPVGTARMLARHLVPQGTLVMAVPDPMVNPIDVLAADHLSHFTSRSLCQMIGFAGLHPVSASRTALPGSWLMAAKRATPAQRRGTPTSDGTGDASTVAERTRDPEAMAELGPYWSDVESSLSCFIARVAPAPGSVAIYGAGVYGAYLKMRSALAGDRFACFIDRNPHKQDTMFHDLPVHDVDQIDAAVEHVLIGVRPESAAAVASLPQLADKHCFCLPAWKSPCTA